MRVETDGERPIRASKRKFAIANGNLMKHLLNEQQLDRGQNIHRSNDDSEMHATVRPNWHVDTSNNFVAYPRAQPQAATFILNNNVPMMKNEP